MVRMSIGFTLPFKRSSGSLGLFQMTNDELSTIQNDIHSLLVTNWGERVMQYNFGCNLREFIFEQSRGEELKAKIADRILSQLATWLPFVIISDLNIYLPEDTTEVPENGVGIFIAFSLKNKPDLQGKESYIITV